MKRIIRRIETAARLQSAISIIAIVFSSLAVAPAADAEDKGPTIFYVDCDKASGGDGSKRARPLPTITAALDRARDLGGAEGGDRCRGGRVRSGDSADRARLLGVGDGRAEVRFARRTAGRHANGGHPLDGADSGRQHYILHHHGRGRDNFAPEHRWWASPPLDGPGTMPIRMPLGVLADRADNFALNHLRIIGTGQAIRSEGSSGLISSNYLSGDSGMFLSGGAANDPPSVVVTNNTIVYRTNGVAMTAVTAVGTFLRATVTDNDIVTSYMNSGPTNPAAFRVNPTDAVNTAGTVEVVAEGNLFGGSAKYGIMIHGGMLTRHTDGQSYTGDVTAEFSNNVIDSAVVFPALLTFTNARATVFPCELNPTITVGCQQPGSGKWEYLTNALFDLRHSGELIGALIDHPEFQPFDGYAPLGNTLVINRETVDYQTFVVVPQ